MTRPPITAPLASLLVALFACSAFASDPPRPPDAPLAIETVVPPEAGFFSKRAVVHGVLLQAHADVSDDAFRECARRLSRELSGAPEVSANLAAMGARMQIIGKDHACSDLPMFRHLKGKPFDGKDTIDTRGRGYGGLYCSCGEENLLKLPSDPYRDHRDICSHEFAHTILEFGCDKAVYARVEAQYKRSLAAGRWKGMYAATNTQEFFAELTMWYFDSRGDFGRLKPQPTPGPDWLKRYDPDAYALLDDLYTGRLKPARIESEILVSLPLDSEPTVRSQSEKTPTTLIFLNDTPDPVERFWIDHAGRRKPYGRLEPGSATPIDTYATHPWLVVSKDGTVLGLYAAGEKVGKILINRPEPVPQKNH